jgi:diguanylate cyclase (GGDEF)-like protein/PAS domain S-box-containing protein
MQIAPIPANEIERISALHAAHILDTAPEEIFDRITRLAAHMLGMPIALVTLVDTDRQWFKSRLGIETRQTARDLSFCGHVVYSGQPLVVNDASDDQRFADHPLVTGAPHIRFYAGIPLLSLQRLCIGTLCVIDRVPRTISSAQLAALNDLARMAEDLFRHAEQTESSNRLLVSLHDSEERYRELVEHAPTAIMIADVHSILFVNLACMAMLGAEHRYQLVGQPTRSMVAPEYHDIAKRRAAFAFETGRPNPPLEMAWMRLDGSRVEVEVSTVSYLANDQMTVQIIARDNTARKQFQRELEKLATHDLLTGLPNRAVLTDRIKHGIGRWQRQGVEAVIAFLNLDHFKEVNDAFGHGTGDQVLAAVGKILQRSVRQNDTVARIGNDEFVLILEGIDETEVGGLLARLSDNVRQPIFTNAHEITVSCSVGYCRYPLHGDSPDALLNAADTAMYRAKALGRCMISEYSADMQSVANERMTMESSLRLALKNDELVLHYQPKRDLRSGVVVGVEALVRWQHPEFGLISPARFIPVAEETGLIVPMGDWILRTACEQALLWKNDGIASMPVAVNLSARQFLQPDIVARVRDIVAETGLPPHLLELELTESLSMDSPEKSIAVLNALKAIGLTLTLDDFGTGYSNLSYLKRFPLDKLKLDQSFVRDMTLSSEALAISQAIITLAHSLHLKVVAEGVETQEQLSLLGENGCDEVQGFLFSKPLPVAQCSTYLLGHQQAQQLGQQQEQKLRQQGQPLPQQLH